MHTFEWKTDHNKIQLRHSSYSTETRSDKFKTQFTLYEIKRLKVEQHDPRAAPSNQQGMDILPG